MNLPAQYRQFTSAAAFLLRPIRLVTATSNGCRVHTQADTDPKALTSASHGA